MFRKSFALYLTIAADVLGWGVVITIFTPLIFTDSAFLSASHEVKSLWLGFLFAIFPFGQFFAAPLLGEFSDRIGRKKMLLISTLGSSLGMALSAISISIASIWLLFFSRLFGGILAGNQSLALTAMVDLVKKQDKPKQLAKVSIVKGISFAIGPYIGGKLSEPNIVSWFSFSTPLWFGALFFLLVFFILLLFFQETFKPKSRESIVWLQSMKNIFYVTKDLRLLNILFITLLGLIAWLCFIFFLPAFLLDYFTFGPGKIGDVNGFLAIFVALGGLSLQWFIKKKISLPLFYTLSLLLIFLGNFLVYLFQEEFVMWIAVAIGALGYATFQPVYSTIASNMSSKETQGKLFGILLSFFAFTAMLGPIIGSWLLAHGTRLPFLNGSIFSALAICLFLLSYRKLRKS